MSMLLVQTVTVGSGGAATIQFTGIPQTGTDLLILLSARSYSAGNTNITIDLNGSAASFSSRSLRGAGSGTPSSSTRTDNTMQDVQNYPGDVANTFANTAIYFTNYAATALNKTLSIDGATETNAATAFQSIFAAQWSNVAAITQVTIGGDFVQNSSASLYTITKA